MREKFFSPKIVLRLFAAIILLALCLLPGIGAGIQAYAATDAGSSIQNPAFTLTSTNGSAVSTKANPNETTVLIFGHTKCGYTRSTLNSISSCSWVKRSDIRVIFAETNGHTKEEVLAYEQGYQCEDMIFCYDESDGIISAMIKYAGLFGMSGGRYPMIALIDKDNHVQNILMGAKTADEILNEIKKFEDIDDNGSSTPPSGDDSGIENIVYGLTAIEGTTVSTKANPNETTVLVFGYTTCGNTRATLRDIDQSSWAGRSDIRVIFADVYGATLDETKEFSQNYTSGNIIFCHDESFLNYNLALTYLSFYDKTGGTFPYIVLIDKNNKIQSLTLGSQTAAEILAEIERFTKEDQPGETPGENPGETPGEKPGETPGEKPGETPGENPGERPGETPGEKPGEMPGETPGEKPEEKPVPSVANVTKLKASSASKKVKLTWNKVSNASGYIVYQYNASKKTWSKKVTLKANAASYTINKLTPGTAYRFAVKAFLKAQNGKQATSKSYTSVYTATAPDAVSFKVTSGKKKATLRWSKVKGATGYTVYYKSKAKGSWKKLKATKGTSFTKTKLKSGTAYYFTVKAYKTYKKTTYTSAFRSKKAVIK